MFDFGLSKEINEDLSLGDGTYKHTAGQTGSIRYMAPEVFLERPYNMSCDAVIWGIVGIQTCPAIVLMSSISLVFICSLVVSNVHIGETLSWLLDQQYVHQSDEWRVSPKDG